MPFELESSRTHTLKNTQAEVRVLRHGPPLSRDEDLLVRFTGRAYVPKESNEVLLRTAKYYRKLEDGDEYETGFQLPPGTQFAFGRQGEWHETNPDRVRLHLNSGWIYCVARWETETRIVDLAESMGREHQFATCLDSSPTLFAESLGVAAASSRKMNAVDVIHGRVEYEESEERDQRLEQEFQELFGRLGKVDQQEWEKQYDSWAARVIFAKRLRFREEREYRFLVVSRPDEEALRLSPPPLNGVESHFGSVLRARDGVQVG